jgi:hypothetical protein
MMEIIEHTFSIASLLSLFILGPAFGRALLLWWDKRRERSLPSQHIALAICTMIALTGLIMIYGVIWQANDQMVAWYSWINSMPINGDVNAEVSGSVDVSGSVETSH